MFEDNKVLSAKSIPSLEDSAILRYLTFSILYVAQGIPAGLLFYAFPAWLAMNDLSPTEIGGYIAVVSIPWSFKIINAPFMDRFTFLPMGRRRPWVLLGQFGLVVSFLVLSLIPDPINNLILLMVVGFIVNLFTVIQDIAVDGMAIDILPVDQQARANGLMWGSKMIGVSVSVSLGSWMINEFGFFITICCFSILIMFIMIFPIILRERKGERLLPWTDGEASEISANLQLHSWRVIAKSLIKVFFLPFSFIMGVGVFSLAIGDGLIDALLPIFTVQKLNWADTEYSQVFATAKLVGGILGMFVGGALIDFFGKVRMITIYIILLIISVSAISFLNNLWANDDLIIGFIVIFYILYTFNTIAIFASAMQLSWKKIAATQFTLYMAISNLGMSVGAAIIGPLKDMLDWEFVILTYIAFAIVMLVVIQFVNFDKHQKQVEELETNFSE